MNPLFAKGDGKGLIQRIPAPKVGLVIVAPIGYLYDTLFPAPSLDELIRCAKHDASELDDLRERLARLEARANGR